MIDQEISDETPLDAGFESEEFENGEDVLSQVKKIKDKLKKFRKTGLSQDGEYSYENLTFKYLRRNGYIKKLIDLKTKITDKELSIKQ